jgi:methyl-accepting chemotaxis protein
LQWILPALENINAQAYTKRLIAQMVEKYDQQHHKDLLPDIVNLFEPADRRPEARKALRELLTDELAHLSRDALIDGLDLKKQSLLEDCTLSLVTLANLPSRQEEVVQAVRQALRNPDKRRGAHITLIRCGQLAVKQVYQLLWDSDRAMVDEACSILAEMGGIAFPYIYELAHDRQRRSDANKVFMDMSGTTAAEGILSALATNDIQKMEIAFYLLHMRIDNEYRSGRFDMTIDMLQQAYAQPNSDTRLRILAALLFFNNNTQQRKKIADHIVNTIKSSPKHHTEFMRTLLLLGSQAEEPLAKLIDATTDKVQLEAIGTLGTLVAHPRITGFVEVLARSERGRETLDLSVQKRGFHALGGLLASGIYDPDKLSDLQQNSNDPTSSEFYSELLGTRYWRKIERLEKSIDKLNKDIQLKDKTIADLGGQVQRLQRDINVARQHASDAERRVGDAQQRAETAENRAVAAERLVNSLREEVNRLREEINRLRGQQ